MGLTQIGEWITWGVALFFAGSWTFGMLASPEFRLKANVAAVLFWWGSIAFVLLTGASVFHLWWLMPMSLLVTFGALPRTSLGTILFTRGIIIALGWVFCIGLPCDNGS
jgi:hypothetical protein